MAISADLLASGPGWQANDFVCTSGPRDRAFEEQHEGVSIAAVTEGTFSYRTPGGAALLGPGAVLLGNHGQCFACGHEHGVGDRCLAFSFEPAFFDTVLRGVPGARRSAFAAACLPASEALTALLAAAETARDERNAGALEEIGLRLAGAASSGPEAGTRPTPTARDARRIGEIVRLIEARAEERLSVSELAARAAMSPYHFLRTFRAAAGMTPHQYVLRLRLHRAAVRLRRSEDEISAIALDAGFNDLSTFNRRFRRVMGVNPLRYRAEAPFLRSARRERLDSQPAGAHQPGF